MSSIIQGYEYDIFISYRQKDNKYDGWVTEFVENLRKELEATFKDEISIYLDENPHDGILETYNVDKSLENKLKCPIFIPIISQTYCDPRSFAWQNEFIAFNKMAQEDVFGRDIRLENGNTASRILPVKIHDIDASDKTLLESELGGPMRSVEFIFKSPGVNRPLKPDDSRTENLNHTYYRDQINKVANAIKGIINSLKPQNHQEFSTRTVAETKTTKQRRLKIFTFGFPILIIFCLSYFIFSKTIIPLKPIEKSIAVLPFHNDSPDTTNTYFINGIMGKVLNNLQVIKDLRVISRTSVEQYRNTTKTIPEIGKELDVNYIVEAEGQKFGNKFSINAKLFRVKKENKLWSNVYEQDIKEVKDIFDIQTKIAQKIAYELETTITPEENQLIEKSPLTNLTAYDFYERGSDEYSKYQSDINNVNALKKSEDYYHQTLKYDSNFAQAYTGLARVYWDKHSTSEEYFSNNYMDSVLVLCNIALSLDNKLAEAFSLRGDYYTYKGEIQKAIDEYDHALSINPNFSEAYMGKGLVYEHDDYVKSIDNYQKASAINRGNELPAILRSISEGYWSAGFPEKGNYFNAQAFALDQDSSKYLANLGFAEQISDNSDKAITYLLRAYSMDTSDNGIMYDIAYNYMFQNNSELSLKYFPINIDTLNFHKSFIFAQMHHIGWALWENGRRKEGEFFFRKQLEYSQGIIEQKRPWGQKLYPYFDMAEVYAFKGDKEKAYKYLNLFNQRRTMPLWILAYLKYDPLLNSIRNESAFQKIEKEIEAKYLGEHERVRIWLAKNNLL